MDRYKREGKLGEGQFGVVYKALDTQTNKMVAIKKIRILNYRDGVHFTALREIKLLGELEHEHVVPLLDVFFHKQNLHLVYPLMMTDLAIVIRDTQNIMLTNAHIKKFMLMLLEGVRYLHENFIVHRDLAPSNMLLDNDGNLRLGDFGLARRFGSPETRMTPDTVTLWYRAPELLFGASQYSTAVDLWSVGCVFAELMLREPFLPGTSEINQLERIFQMRGTPDKKAWRDHDALPRYLEFASVHPPDLRQLFTAATEDAIDLLQRMLTLAPSKRITVQEALDHPYFKNRPAPCETRELPLPAGF